MAINFAVGMSSAVAAAPRPAEAGQVRDSPIALSTNGTVSPFGVRNATAGTDEDDIMNADRIALRLFHQLLGNVAPEARDEEVAALVADAREMVCRRNQSCWPIASEGQVGCVLTGTIRKYAIRANGQRQIVDLLMAGDFIGLAPLDPCFSIEAVADGTRIAVFRSTRLAALAEAYPVVNILIRDRAADAIRRLENHLLVQGRTTASEKVRGYLVSMCHRIKNDEYGALVLPVSRYDIADHLGLAVETVSRAMTALKRCKMIALESPRLVEIRTALMLADGEIY